MKAVTGNRLADGCVVYLAPDDRWTEKFGEAQLFADDDAEPVLDAAKKRVTEIASAYLIAADDSGPAGREALRETIRSRGPTVRLDLGKQAGGAS